jgi:trimeric autotransporter adhesin
MKSPKTFSSRFITYWVALAVLATLAMPAYATAVGAVATPSTATFSYSTGDAPPSSSQIVAITLNGEAATPSAGAWAAVAAPLSGYNPFEYQISGSQVYIGLNMGTVYTLARLSGASGTWTSTLTLTVGSTTVPVTVTLVLNAAITVTPSTTAMSIPVALGSSATRTLTLTTNSVTVPYTAVTSTANGLSWLTLSSYSGTAPGSFNIIANSISMSAGAYVGYVDITPTSQTTAIRITVTMNLGTTSTAITASPTSVSAAAASATTSLAAQTVTLSGSASTYTAFISYTGTSGWLTLNSSSTVPASGTFSSGAATLSVLAVPTGLTEGVSYSATIYVSGDDGTSTTIPVTLSIGTTTTTGLAISPTSFTFVAPTLNVSPATQTLNVSSTYSSVTYTATPVSSGGSTGTGGWLSLSSTSGSLPASIVVSVNTSGLTAQVYTGYIYFITAGGTTSTQVLTVTLTVGSTDTVSTTIAPTSLAFAGQVNGATTPGAQTIVINGTSGATYAATVSMTNGTGWLLLENPTGTAPGGQVTVKVSTSGLSAATYTGSVSIVIGGVTTSVPVTLTMTTTPVLTVTPGNLVCNFSSSTACSNSLFFAMSDNSTISSVTLAPGATWITPSATTLATLPAVASVSIDPSTLSTYANSSTLTVTASGVTNSPLSIPIIGNVLYGTVTSGVTLSPSVWAPSAVVTTASTSAQTLSIASTTSTSYSIVSNASWLTVSSYSGYTGTTITMYANSTGLAAGTYTGTLTVTTGTSVVTTVTVTFTVSSGTVTLSPSTLSFSYQAGGSLPSTQTISVTPSSSSTTYAAAAATTSGGSWLTVSPTSATGTQTLSVGLVSGVLTAAGTYYGTVTVTPTGGTSQVVNVTVTVTAAASVSASPSALTFSYVSGESAPAAQSVTVSSATTGLAYTATVAMTSGSNWLVATPTSGTTPGTVAVSVTPSSLDAGTYTGTVTIAGTNGATGSTAIAVSLTVTAPLPTITSVTNAASFASGSIAPGEFITIFGTNVGPSSVALASFDDTNRLPTTLSNVQVLVGGVLAPIYALQGSGQLTAVVPYSISGKLDTYVQVKYKGNTSNAYTVGVASAAPGVFTQSASGTGPGVIANYDNTLNTASNAAAKGSTIVIYCTGEGVVQNTSGAKPDSGAKIVATTLADLPRPVLTTAVLINGQPADVSYAGEIYGLSAGIMQVNATVPSSAGSGTVPIVVSVGTYSSQSGVTVAIK